MSQELNNNVEAATVTVQPTYLELISKDEKAVKREQLSIRAQESAIEVAKAIFGLNSDIAKTKQLISVAQRQIPYSVKSEFALTKKLVDLEEELAFYQGIKSVRFHDAQI